jgi:aminoglycoside/choline kinase family phosphotransferase
VQYFYEASALGGRPPPERVFHAAAVQRLLQALGAYGKLWRGDGLDWYRPFILPALGLLGEAAAAAACPRLAGFAAATAAECRPCVGG